MPIGKDIQLIQIDKNLYFEFMVEEEYYDLIINPIYEAFQSGTIITDDNKRILPVRIFTRIDFRNNARYRINEWNITSQNEYIIIRLNMALVEYHK